MDTNTPSLYHEGDIVRIKRTGALAEILYFDAADRTYRVDLKSSTGSLWYSEDEIEPYNKTSTTTPKTSINKLSEYAARMDANPQPTDQLCITIDRAARDWFVSDLTKREKRLTQAVSDPKIKSTKNAKRQRELSMLTATLNSLQAAERKQ